MFFKEAKIAANLFFSRKATRLNFGCNRQKSQLKRNRLKFLRSSCVKWRKMTQFCGRAASRVTASIASKTYCEATLYCLIGLSGVDIINSDTIKLK